MGLVNISRKIGVHSCNISSSACGKKEPCNIGSFPLSSTFLHPLGVDCVIVKSGKRICGTGAALANAPLVQDKSFFEMKIQCSGKDSHLSVLEYMHTL